MTKSKINKTQRVKYTPASPKSKRVTAPPNIKLERKKKVQARARAREFKKKKNGPKNAKKKLTWDSAWEAPAYRYHDPREASLSAIKRVSHDYFAATLPGHAWTQSRNRKIAEDTARDCQRWSNQLDRIPKNAYGVISGKDAKKFLLNL